MKRTSRRRSRNYRVQQQSEDSPAPSCVSMKSGQSMDQPLYFKDGNQSIEQRHQQRSKVASAQSVQQHQSELIKRAEDNAHAFLDKELKKLWRDLFTDYLQCTESPREEEVEKEDGKEEEQRRRAIEGVVDIAQLCLMEMNQVELAEALRSKSQREEEEEEEHVDETDDDEWQQKVCSHLLLEVQVCA